MRGSITVEAALVLPLVILLMVSLMIIGGVEHDKAVAQSIIDKYTIIARDAVFREKCIDNGKIDYKAQAERILIEQVFNNVSGEYGNKMKSVSKRVKSELSDSLIVCDVNGVQVDASTGKVMLKVKLSNSLHKFIFVNLTDENVYVNNSKYLIDECEVVRISNMIWRKNGGD